MKKFKVVVTHRIHEDGIDLLKSIGDVIVSDRLVKSEEELIDLVRDADALLVVRGIEPVTRRVIDSASNLKIIARHGVGYDDVDVNAATERGIWVTIAPVNALTVAEHAITLMFALSRKLINLDKFVRTGLWYRERWAAGKLTGVDIYGKTLGIIGLGRIGWEVAKRSLCLGMKTIYYDIMRRKNLEGELSLEFKPLDELLAKSDFITIHVPLTKETFHMIGERELKLMKPTAYIINTSRGGVIDTEALIKALKEGWISGAALDVFEEEPLSPNHPLTKNENVILTPHAASSTHECMKRLALTAAEEILRVLKGERPLYPINQVEHSVRTCTE